MAASVMPCRLSTPEMDVLVDLALLAEELSDGLSDEQVAYSGSEHDVLDEEGPGELRAGCFDVDGGRQVAPSFSS